MTHISCKVTLNNIEIDGNIGSLVQNRSLSYILIDS
jgi:hypothetical protein